ncbi:sugar ABC transporter substrate-binding protein [Spirilliplanes yamanashiensis]|uniref:Sugar ABC transporter substrate-binding protein n=1 Tax=Spirilliplanes yamanashiensis TaxID=42233 RepID=A0A8J3YD17_9ACTN|nr:sugar ABC transporter substrate-binding protein [Spirilliplanes yamanashiensis]MDP9819045.1 multiple sugar transport system substrate-binding protein [Spirilliplanes yamanashiensis]GIJ05500.1 sugar ABC transporter substrate-binding protein [Spirilliplanes yamanashiensis]
MTDRIAPRGIGALLALALVAGGMAACGTDEPGQDAKAPLQIWIRKPPGSPTEQTAKDLAAKFTAASGVPTQVTALFEDFETKLQQAAAQKQLPDIVINDTAQLGSLVKQGLVREVDRAGLAGSGDLSPIAWDAAKGADGKHYAVPFSAQSFALFIRSDWREKVGAEAPTSWEELDKLAVQFTKEDPDGNGKADTYGYVIPGSTKRGYTSWYATSFLWSAGGDFLTGEPGKFTTAVNSPQAVEAVDHLKGQFCTDKTVVPGAITMETTQAHQVFESGKGGIYFTGPYNMARFDKALGKEKYEVVALPAGPGGKASSLAEGENVYLMAGSKNEDGQKKFAEYAVSTEGQTVGMAGDTAGNIVRLPVNSTVQLANVRQDARWQVFDEIYKTAGRYTPAVPDWTPFRQSSADAMNAIFADCASDTKATLDKLAETFTAELTKQEVKG